MNDISFEIKTGNFECNFTGEAIDVLVKANNGEESTGWLSIPTLKKCLKFLKACTDLKDEESEEEESRNDLLMEILSEVQLIRQQQRITFAPAIPPTPSYIPSPSGPSCESSEAPLTRLVKASKPTGPSQRDKIAMKQFAEEIVELVNNPPTDDNPMAKSQGLSEAHIRECVHKWKNLFEDKMSMYPVLFKAFGMTKERFETILRMAV